MHTATKSLSIIKLIRKCHNSVLSHPLNRCFKVSCGHVTVDQLMWRTIVHHIPRWREPSPLRDFMRRLWPFAIWNVDCLHANWLIRCIWIAVCVISMENKAHPVCIIYDKIPLGCGGRQTRVARMMWWTIIWDVGDDICPWMYVILSSVFWSAVGEFLMVTYSLLTHEEVSAN